MLNRVVIIALTSNLFLSGCANIMGPSPEYLEQQQQAALTRWNDCLDRTAAMPSNVAFVHADHMVEQHCEGYKRDVLMTFPASMEKEIEDILRQRSQSRMLNTTAARIVSELH